jgi:acyl carrier protein
MQLETVITSIRRYLIEHFPLTQHTSNDDFILASGLVDSLGILGVITFLEEEFQILVDDEELLPDNFASIARMAAFVQSKLNSAHVRQTEE